MSLPVPPPAPDLGALLSSFMKARAATSLRGEGTARMLGDLRVSGLEPGLAIHLSGAKRRDQLIPAGSVVNLSILVEDKAYYLRATMLEPLLAMEGDTQFPPVLRVSWPREPVQESRRRDLRVATPDQASLRARVLVAGVWHEACVLNLTESGLGLGLPEGLELAPRQVLQVETRLPGDRLLATSGEVRHVEVMDGDDLPLRIGLILQHTDGTAVELLRSFVQERRTDRSDSMRQTL